MAKVDRIIDRLDLITARAVVQDVIFLLLLIIVVIATVNIIGGL